MIGQPCFVEFDCKSLLPKGIFMAILFWSFCNLIRNFLKIFEYAIRLYKKIKLKYKLL